MTDREKLAELHSVLCRSLCAEYDEAERAPVIDLLKTAEKLLANGVVVREKGEWSRTDRYGNFDHYNAHCTKCGYEIGTSGWSWEWKHNFCPNCGADMRGAETDGA